MVPTPALPAPVRVLVMTPPSYRARTGVFTRPLVIQLLTAGLWSAIVNISLFSWLLRSGRPLAPLRVPSSAVQTRLQAKMGTVFRKTVTRPLPTGAEIFVRAGERFAKVPRDAPANEDSLPSFGDRAR